MKKVFVCVCCCVMVLLSGVDLSANNNKKFHVGRAKSSKSCPDKLKACYNALRNYADLHNGQLPAKNNYAGLEKLLSHGVTIEDFLCPYYKAGKEGKYDVKADERVDARRVKLANEITALESKKDKSSKDKRDILEKKRRLSKLTNDVKFAETHSAYIYFGGINLGSARTQVPKMIIMCDKIDKTRSKNTHLMVLMADNSVEQIKLEKNSKDSITDAVSLVKYLSKKYKYPQSVSRALYNKAVNIDAELKKLADEKNNKN